MDPAKVTQLLKEEKNWARISKQLTFYAHKKLGQSYERARDLSQDAIMQVWDPKYVRWDPDRHSLLEHLMRTVNGLAINAKRRHSKKERATVDDELAELHSHDDNPSALQAEKETHERAYELLSQSVAGDEIASASLELMRDGVEDPRDIAAALQVDILKVRNARRRIAAHSEKIAREMAQ